MKRGLFYSLILALTVAHCGAPDGVAIYGGFSGGTYDKVARSLNSLPGYSFTVSTSEGSFDNVNAIVDGDARYSLAQLDNLQSGILSDGSLAQKVKVLLPLYGEEVHFIVRREIQKPSDLQGKRVFLGNAYSGTRNTALIFLDQLGIGEGKITLVDATTEDAIGALVRGDIDAVFQVVGVPAKILSDIPASAKDQIHLLEIAQVLEAPKPSTYMYQEALIPAGTYPWQEKAATTFRVQSALLGRADIPDAEAEKLVRDILANQSELAGAHEKWNYLSEAASKKIYDNVPELFHPGAAKVVSKL